MEKKRRTSLSGGARWLPASVTLVEGESGVLESGVSYATDLLHSLSAVRSKTATSQKVADEFLTFLGARARAEEAYAKSLRKLAGGFAPPTTPDSTLNEAMEALRGDLLNKAVQHEVLATSLETEVAPPIAELRAEHAAEARASCQEVARAQKDLRAQEEKFRGLQHKYERAWHVACDRCGDARAAAGGVLRLDDKGPAPQGAASSDGSSSSSTSSSSSSSSSSKSRPPLATEAMGAALSQWLLPTEAERKGQLLALAADVSGNERLNERTNERTRLSCPLHLRDVRIFSERPSPCV